MTSNGSRLLGDELRFEFGKDRPGNASDNSLGNYLKLVFSNSSSGDIPTEIQQQFNNNTPLPNDLASSIGAAAPPATTAAPAPVSAPAPAPAQKATAAAAIASPAGPGATQSPSVNAEIPPSPRTSSRRAAASMSAAAVAASVSHAAEARAAASPSIINIADNSVRESATPSWSSDLPGMNPVPDGGKHIDISEYLNMPQSQAAKTVKMASSTFSKRWKEAAPNRKWPWRTICKLDKQITTLLHNIPPGGQIPEDIEVTLMSLLRLRQEELKPVKIRL